VSDRVRRAFLAVPAVPGARASLDSVEAHHVARVLRLRAGDALAVFDGSGGEWSATVDEVARDQVRVVVGAARPGDPEPPVRITLVQALVRPERIEWVLQKGTEIGVAAFRLVAAERSEAEAPSPSRLERYRRILLEACKQSGRRRIPSLEEGPLDDPPPGVLAIVLDTTPDAPTLGAVLARPPVESVWIAVGPEGGFTDREIAACASRGWLRASLGPRTLRTETAGSLAAGLVLHVWGDLGAGPARP
jgi:16S rRNA (uracil1498-N3)-methyltransferase